MKEYNIINVGLDDTDSLEGGCTTHLTGLFLLKLLEEKPGILLADYPLLVRLNPAIPWKTRGNAATVLRIMCDCDPEEVAEAAWSIIEEYVGDRKWGVKGPGLVVAMGEPWRDPGLRLLYRKALTDVVALDQARGILEKRGAIARGSTGIIGASAALAALAPGDDYTFELVFYRDPSRIGEERCIDEGRAGEVEASLPPCVFNNYDQEEGRVTAAPGGYDPVLAGFRGDCPAKLFEYRRVLCEDPMFWVLYRSNQHTDAHKTVLTPRLTVYSTGSARATITGEPVVTPGGHVVVPATVNGVETDLVFYRETGPLSKAARMLRRGDEVEVLGSVKPYGKKNGRSIAVEKMWIESIAPHSIRAVPRCPRCGRRMKSAGKDKGYRCKHCNYKTNTKTIIHVYRDLSPGEYTPKTGRLPHLVKPHWRAPRALLKLPMTIRPEQVIGT
ncbi:MAG: tRNA(Ile)(2)-agmatinylcytidine synthase [Desulfurococcales archaeon]|nr:tRNA(Ile)(2)-agmatinylcytidine synthase [Desulfurococcales archaeon]